MNDDRDRTHKDNGPQNLAVLRHMSLNVSRKDPRKQSLRAKFNIATWNNAYLTSLLEQF
jgi:hypothetical protein